VLLIAPDRIFWFATEDGIVKAHTDSEVFWANYQLSDLESNLPAELFFRARREVLVNVNKIKEIRPYFKSGFLLVMSDIASTEIAVSARQVHPLRQRIPGL
jgi:two-component system LytT family response regulator